MCLHRVKIFQYAIAAFGATVVNIGAQWLIVKTFGSGSSVIYISVLIGTVVGLIAKFAMDKYLIFSDKAGGSQAITQMTKYAATGILTTLVFWGVELGFHYAYGSDLMRYVGGVVGLAVGYTLKYMIDTKYVFTHVETMAPTELSK